MSRDTNVAARSVATKHGGPQLPYVSRSTSDIEATVLGGISEAPETSLVMSVLFVAHMVRTCRPDTYLFSCFAHTCDFVKADSTIDVCVS